MHLILTGIVFFSKLNLCEYMEKIMDNNQYLIKLLNREIDLIEDLITKLKMLGKIDKFMNPTSYTRFGSINEFDEVREFLKLIRYSVDKDMYEESKGIINHHYDAVYRHGYNIHKDDVIARRIQFIEELEIKLDEYESFISSNKQ